MILARKGNEGKERLEPHTCCLCKKVLKNRFSTQQHLEMVHKVNPFTVKSIESYEALPVVKKPGKLEALALKGNEGLRTKDPHTCCLCQKVFVTRRTLYLHLNTIHLKTKKWCCDHCPMVFFARNVFINHLKASHGLSNHRQETSGEQNTCGLCQKVYKCRGSLRRHLEIVHARTKTFECDFCAKFYLDKQILRNHIKQHMQMYTPRESCPICFRMLTSGCLRRHLKTHNEKDCNYVCEKCSDAFKSAEELRR